MSLTRIDTRRLAHAAAAAAAREVTRVVLSCERYLRDAGMAIPKAVIGLLASACLAIACRDGPDTGATSGSFEPPPTIPVPVLYEGGRVIPGDGSAPIEESAFLVESGVITQLGNLGDIDVPEDALRVDLSGKTIMPALIGAHGHVGYQAGLTFALENYTRENIYDDLRRAAYFGIGTALTLGIDRGDLIYEIRRETMSGDAGVSRLLTAGRGIGGPNTGPGNPIYARGVAYEVLTEQEGRAAIQELAPMAPDTIKIWLDERDGRGIKLGARVAEAIIAEAGRFGLTVTAHVHGHDDADVAVRGGAYAMSHLVQDRVMDDALVEAIVARGVYVTPTLSMAERNNYAGATPPWLDEPYLSALLNGAVAPEVIAQLRRSFSTRQPEAAERSRATYAIMLTNIGKLNAAGARIVLGADTGLLNHFWGYAEHRELELLVAAGLTPMQAIVAGTGRAAEYLQLDDLGVLAPGRLADFLVLDANPLDDIRNTRRISAFYMKGNEIDREMLGAELLARQAP